jgi:Ykl077w/Psg1 (Pma1 Stabilization in Golgi)
MFASKISLPAIWLLLLLGTTSALPAPDVTAAQEAANPTAVWVSVDASGQPRTVTPVLTTISGTPTVLSGAPYDVTGTVFTKTNLAIATTETEAAVPTAVSPDGSGAFAACKSSDGDFKPFCAPLNNATLYPGTTYYSKPQHFPQPISQPTMPASHTQESN